MSLPASRRRAWTFGGTAPGPVLRGKVGDRFEITLVNDGKIGHSIDFHAGALAPDEPMRTIQPGETLTYSFTATQAGIWMYHCSTMPMSMHIANGMYGAVVIDPPDLAPVDREYVLVQGELYLGAEGETGGCREDRGRRTRTSWRSTGTPTSTCTARSVPRRGSACACGCSTPGRTGRRRSTSSGPSSTPSTSRARTSWTPMSPAARRRMALQPAQGGFVELAFPEPGSYPFVTHRMSDAEKGARGVFRVE